MYANGTLDKRKYPILKPEDVFLNRIEKTDFCWIWKGSKNHYGYGIFLMPGERAVRAHRYSFEYFKHKIPKGKIILHSCDNPPCVNPAHLRVGTSAENIADANAKRRLKYGMDHHAAKLSESQVNEIRNSVMRMPQIAKAYGVDYSTVWRIRTGQARIVK